MAFPVNVALKPAKPASLPRRLNVASLECRSLLGEGGFAVAMLCADDYGASHVVKLPREVYFAMLNGIERPTILTNTDIVNREVEVLRRIDHPNIVKFEGFDKYQLALIFEYCEGGSLRGILEGGPVPVKEAVGIALQVSDVVNHLHGRDIVHGDLKPENVLFTRDSIPKVSDFNTARFASTLSRTGPGYTPGYAAPEQLMGNPTKASDTWAIGMIMHEMLTGKLPEVDFERGMVKITRTGNEPIDNVIEEALRVKQGERISIRELRSKIEEIYNRWESLTGKTARSLKKTEVGETKKENEARTTNQELNRQLIEAARYGNAEKVWELMEMEVSPNIKDDYGLSPLHHAAMHGEFDTVEILLEYSADVNARDNYGETPLHYAAMNGDLDTVKLLIKYGADPNTKNNDGKTPLDYAEKNGHYDVVKELKQKVKKETETGSPKNLRQKAGGNT
ncbi:ankyrin repeat domain-containing protein [Thermocladium modestius]|nr:ankyrin repeat domain-containing protein [Thermocladium modestius]